MLYPIQSPRIPTGLYYQVKLGVGWDWGYAYTKAIPVKDRANIIAYGPQPEFGLRNAYWAKNAVLIKLNEATSFHRHVLRIVCLTESSRGKKKESPF